MAAGSNILGLVVFSVLLGVVLSRMGEEGAPLVRLFRSLNGAVMRIVSLFMWYSPIGKYWLYQCLLYVPLCSPLQIGPRASLLGLRLSLGPEAQ